MNLPNLISLTRLPLALVFSIYPPLRLLTLFLAALSDGLDGLIARRFRLESPLGKLIDPLTDKVFVGVVLLTLLIEQKMGIEQALFFLSRDFALAAFALYLYFQNRWTGYQFRAFYSGKATTLLQFFTLTLIVANIEMPFWVNPLFVILGVSSFIELYFRKD